MKILNTNLIFNNKTINSVAIIFGVLSMQGCGVTVPSDGHSLSRNGVSTLSSPFVDGTSGVQSNAEWSCPSGENVSVPGFYADKYGRYKVCKQRLDPSLLSIQWDYRGVQGICAIPIHRNPDYSVSYLFDSSGVPVMDCQSSSAGQVQMSELQGATFDTLQIIDINDRGAFEAWIYNHQYGQPPMIAEGKI